MAAPLPGLFTVLRCTASHPKVTYSAVWPLSTYLMTFQDSILSQNRFKTYLYGTILPPKYIVCKPFRTAWPLPDLSCRTGSVSQQYLCYFILVVTFQLGSRGLLDVLTHCLSCCWGSQPNPKDLPHYPSYCFHSGLRLLPYTSEGTRTRILFSA